MTHVTQEAKDLTTRAACIKSFPRYVDCAYIARENVHARHGKGLTSLRWGGRRICCSPGRAARCRQYTYVDHHDRNDSDSCDYRFVVVLLCPSRLSCIIIRFSRPAACACIVEDSFTHMEARGSAKERDSLVLLRNSMSQHTTDTDGMSSDDFIATKTVANRARVRTAPQQSLAEGVGAKGTKAGENRHRRPRQYCTCNTTGW